MVTLSSLTSRRIWRISIGDMRRNLRGKSGLLTQLQAANTPFCALTHIFFLYFLCICKIQRPYFPSRFYLFLLILLGELNRLNKRNKRLQKRQICWSSELQRKLQKWLLKGCRLREIWNIVFFFWYILQKRLKSEFKEELGVNLYIVHVMSD